MKSERLAMEGSSVALHVKAPSPICEAFPLAGETVSAVIADAACADSRRSMAAKAMAGMHPLVSFAAKTGGWRECNGKKAAGDAEGPADGLQGTGRPGSECVRLYPLLRKRVGGGNV